jgi:RNA polymerase sigma-70 factor (ECF subfamily)
MDDFAELLRAAQSGDETAFTTIFRAANPGIVRYLIALGATNAEDLAAETWLSALRAFDAFAGEERAFRAWLFTIARARWVDSVRAGTRRPEVVTEELPERVDPAATDELEAGFTTQQALALIARLPADQAEVVALRYVGGLEVGEVAQVTGRTANHVRVLSHRGLRRLAEILGEKPPDGL